MEGLFINSAITIFWKKNCTKMNILFFQTNENDKFDLWLKLGWGKIKNGLSITSKEVSVQ